MWNKACDGVVYKTVLGSGEFLPLKTNYPTLTTAIKQYLSLLDKLMAIRLKSESDIVKHSTPRA